MKNEWFLHARKWRDTQSSNAGQEIFVVCPSLPVSIQLDCSVGYLSKFQTLEGVTPTALREARQIAEKFEVSPVIGDSVTQKIVGRRFYIPAI